MVRTGLSPNPADHRKIGTSGHRWHRYRNLVMTSVALTKHMRPIARNTSSLISENATKALLDGSAPEKGEVSPDKVRIVQPLVFYLRQHDRALLV